MNTRETLILHALTRKNTISGTANPDLVDHLLAENPARADELTKNVCARIPLALATEMEDLGGLLELNKREIITLAIHDFLEKARGVIEEFNVLPDSHSFEREV